MRLFAMLLLATSLLPKSGYALGGSTCAVATPVGALPYTDGGQLESGFDPNCPGAPVNDLFYVFTASYSGTFRFDMCGSNVCCDQQMRLWTDGTCCSGDTVVVNNGCPDGKPQYDLNMTSGQVVFIEVGKSGGAWADAPLYQFNVTGVPPPGATCDSAIVVGSLPYSDSGQLQSGSNNDCAYSPFNDLFYEFTAPYTGIFRFDMCGSNVCCDQQMRLWTDGTCCSGDTVVVNNGCPDGKPQYDLFMTSGQVVYIEVGKSGGAWADAPLYQFNVTDVPPPGATCDSAIVVGSLPYSDSGQLQSGPNNDCEYSPVNDLYYEFTAASAGIFRFDMCGSDSCCDHQMRIWTGGTCCSGDTVVVNNGCPDGKPQYDLNMTSGQIVYIEVGKSGNALADAPLYQFHVTALSPPNDLCPGTPITSLPFMETASIAGATHNYSGPCATGGSPEVVYSFTATDSALVVASVYSPSVNHAVTVKRGNCLSGPEIVCDTGFNSDTSSAVFWAEPDSTFYFIVDIESYSGNYTFSLDLSSNVNDICPGTPITSLPFIETTSIAGAIHNYTSICVVASWPDVVYNFTATDSAVVVASVISANGIRVVSVGRGNCLSPFAIGCDLGIGSNTCNVAFWVEPDSTYYFIVEISAIADDYTFSLEQSPIVNDICPGTAITSLPFIETATIAGATDNYSGPCATGTWRDVVYSFTALDSATMVASVSSPIVEHAVRVKRGNCLSGLDLVCDFGVGSDTSGVVFLVEPDSTYYFFVEINSLNANYTFTLEEVPPVANDVCPGTPISSLPYFTSASALGGLDDYTECQLGTSPDVVYSYTATDSVQLFSAMNVSFGGIHGFTLYRGACASGTELQCVLEYDADTDATLLFWAEPDSTYYFVIEIHSVSGNFTFSLFEQQWNDACYGTVFVSLPFVDSYTTTHSIDNYHPDCASSCCSGPDVVYTFVSYESQLLEAKVVAAWDEILLIRNNYCEYDFDWNELACEVGYDADSARVTFMTVPYGLYYFIVDGSTGSQRGPFVFSLTALSCPAPDSLVIFAAGDDIVLSWPHVDCDTPTYKVYRAITSDVQVIPANFIGATADSSYTDVGILSGADAVNFYVVTSEP